MRRNRLFKMFTSAVLTGAMVLSMGGMTAFADEPVTEMDFTKKVTTDGNTYSPATTFAFAVAPGADGSFDNKTVKAGPEGGLKLAEKNNFDFTPGEDATAAAEYTKTGKLVTDITAFAGYEPGIYVYNVSETAGTYKGITYDQNTYQVYVYVMRDETTDNLYVNNVLVPGSDGKASALEFVNDYGKDNDGDVNAVTITKKVAGNQSSKNDPFTFFVQVNGDDNEKYKAVITKADQTTTEITLVSKAAAQEITLKDSESVTIYGLSENDSYTVTEDEDASKGLGYTETTVKIGDAEAAAGYTASGTITANTDVTFTNTKDVTTPTGIALTFAPYLLMVALAGVFAVLFLRRRREEF
ncbi:MAG: FctA domain-containing protein [Lachnospiraceae bacterium]|nr:FctA domain-containing protein [Lachnospiraceae bacterium]